MMNDSDHVNDYEEDIVEDSLVPLDSLFIEHVANLKYHCYDITVLQVPLDSDNAQSVDLLQNYINLLSTVYMILQNASHDIDQTKSLPLSVKERLAPLLQWIRNFCKTNQDPVDHIPFKSYLRMNIIENPYIQGKINE